MRLHRVPKSIVSDHNTKFTSTFWHELHRLMGTQLLMSTVFHPQMDGATELANHSIGQILRMVIKNYQKDWAAKCPMVEFALNSSVSAFVVIFYILFDIKILNIAPYMLRRGMYAYVRRWAIYVRPRGV